MLLGLAHLLIGMHATAVQSPAASSMTFNVDGQERSALVFEPQKADPNGTPLIFAFHGHGGTDRAVARKFGLQRLWPEAMVIYPQGLPRAGFYDPEGKRAGWQKGLGSDGDADLHFFDAMLKWARTQQKIDPKRIYTMGHSNGGGFTYLLWTARPGVFAALGAAAGYLRSTDNGSPIPVIQVAGDQDTTVPFNLQKQLVEALKTKDGCSGEGVPYGDNCSLFKGSGGNDVAFYVFSGGHPYHAEASATIIRFFKEHPKKN